MRWWNVLRSSPRVKLTTTPCCVMLLPGGLAAAASTTPSSYGARQSRKPRRSTPGMELTSALSLPNCRTAFDPLFDFSLTALPTAQRRTSFDDSFPRMRWAAAGDLGSTLFRDSVRGFVERAVEDQAVIATHLTSRLVVSLSLRPRHSHGPTTRWSRTQPDQGRTCLASSIGSQSLRGRMP